MSVSYSYILGVDFKSATQIDIPAFTAQIQGSSISTATVQFMVQVGTTVNIYFNTSLSAGDITTLNGLVSSYTYSSSSGGVEVDTNSLQTLSNKLFTTSCYWVDTTDNTKKVGLSLSGMSTATQLTLATSLATSRTYIIPDTGAASSFIMSDSTGTQTISTGNLTYANSSGTVALTGSSKLTMANTSISTSASTGALQSSGGAHFKNLHIAGATHSYSGVAGSLIGLLATVDTTTITVNSTADMAFTSIQQPTLANSVTSSTTTNAYTLYLAGAPIAGTNETITNSYALGVASGKVLIGGTLQLSSGATNGYYLQCDASGNASWSPISFTGALSLTGSGSTTPASATLYSNPASTAFSLLNSYYFNYFNTPVTTGGTLGTASTVYIAGAPANALTSYALNVNAGNCRIGSSTASSSITSGALQVAGGIGCSNLYTSDINMTGNYPCILNIDCNGSQTTPGQIQFTNSGGTGDFIISSNGTDIIWQGGGGRALQMGSFHELYLVGGRNSNTALSFVNGSNATFNTIVLNTNDSIGLIVRGTSGQTADLQQWRNSSNTVLSEIMSDGSLMISATTASTSSTTGALQCAGGAYFGAGCIFNSGVRISTGAGLNSILKSDASGNTSWTSIINNNFTATSTTIFNTTATTPTNITTMSLTPNVAGTYLVLFSTQCTCATNTITLTLRLALNAVAIAATSTIVTTRVANETFSVTLSTIQTFNGTTDNITAQLGSSSGTTTVSANTRYITAIRLST
jgi:hypothetical protein